MRKIIHVDMDAFYASVEQRDDPALRGRPVAVGGGGARGVVMAASYEARRFGVRSAMPGFQARRLCPELIFVRTRFDAYQAASRQIRDVFLSYTDLVEPLSLDEAYLDLAASPDWSADQDLHARVDRLRADIADLTGGLTASVGVASSKLMAKIASEINKPNGLFVVPPGTEAALLGPMQVTVIPGVGPATTERLRRLGVATVEDLRTISEDDLVRTLGNAHGTSLWRLSRAIDDRLVVAERETKSLSVEDTFDHDITDRSTLSSIVEAMSRRLTARLQRNGWSARTVTLKARRHDFETLSRSSTFASPTDSAKAIADTAERLLAGIDVAGGLRLLGVGVTGLSDWVQPDLFDDQEPEETGAADDHDTAEGSPAGPSRPAHWTPGMDVHHTEHGDGWVWGSGLGRVTVRFETRDTPPGPVLTLSADDPGLTVRHLGAPR
jgi:DNA polymerase-4